MPTLETLKKQANKLQLVEGEDYQMHSDLTRIGQKQVTTIELTPQGQAKRTAIIQELFANDRPVLSVPLGREFDRATLQENDIIRMDGLLALSLIRRKVGGYVCTLTDNFDRLKKEQYLARIVNFNPAAQTVRLQFDHWPADFYQYEYLKEKSHLAQINPPISIGPECVIKLQVLLDGQPYEDVWGWAKNAVKRNLLGRK